MKAIYLSVVIPVFNEEENLESLFTRLTKVLDSVGKPFEIIFTNDGSADRSMEILRDLHRRRPKEVRVIDFNGNFGQHTAIMAAFERARGDIVVTLDADLQNPPEEIPKLLAKVEEGFDVVGGFRKSRKDTVGRKLSSKLINFVRELTTDIKMTDQGCMLRAYRRAVVQAIVQTGERSLFIPALAYKFAARPGEVEVEHDARAAGESKYSYYKLIRLNFDLITGFTTTPLQLFTLFSMLCSAGSLSLVAVLLYRRLVLNLDRETFGVFTLFAILFFLISVAMVGIGLIGEYVGRTYQSVQQRPRYVTREILEQLDD
ncbi:MAG: glycosyltransferase [Verrucomicrobia bacterium]|nr:glycosyltransferase [Verrucomicrobiota bacterium]